MTSSESFTLNDIQHSQASGYEESTQSSVYSRFRSEEPDQDTSASNLPRPDNGGRAWLFLAGSFMIECLIWGACSSCFPAGFEHSLRPGFPFSFGIFLKYYSTHPPFSKQPSGISAIGTSAMGISTLTSFPQTMFRRISFRRCHISKRTLIPASNEGLRMLQNC